MQTKIALIKPTGRVDYLTRTLVDGLELLSKDGECVMTDSLSEADLIIISSYNTEQLVNQKKEIDELNLWGKTAFVDGSELGGNRRFTEVGKINEEMLKKCVLYFRREKPYPAGVLPLPFGIESRQVAYKKGQEKDIDFVCIFGQDKYPPLRAQVRDVLEDFCKKEKFSYRTKQTGFLFWNIYSPSAQKRFYKILARAKVGVSVGGGGFDTARFWEILGNNCLLMTESIDIYPDKGASELNYSRVTEFKDLDDFKFKLQKMGEYIRTQYPPANIGSEYQEILARHGSQARVQGIIDAAKSKRILK